MNIGTPFSHIFNSWKIHFTRLDNCDTFDVLAVRPPPKMAIFGGGLDFFRIHWSVIVRSKNGYVP